MYAGAAALAPLGSCPAPLAPAAGLYRAADFSFMTDQSDDFKCFF